MKILITGSSGYVGAVLCRYFAGKNISVAGIDIVEDPHASKSGSFRFYRCSVTDKETLEKIFRNERPTHIIHCAYLMDPIHDKKREYGIDVGGSEHVLRAADKTSSVKQIILMSSASAYGAWPDNPQWITEDRELRPRDYRYGIFKKEVEQMYNNGKTRRSLRIVILRMCTAVGPSYYKKGGVVFLIANAPVLPAFNGRNFDLQFIHEYDICRVIERIAGSSTVCGTFNLAPNSFSSIRKLAPKKIFIPVPLFIARGAAALLWLLHLSPIMPSALTVSAYSIIIDPSKLMKRLKYKFRYSTDGAFKDAVKKRKL